MTWRWVWRAEAMSKFQELAWGVDDGQDLANLLQIRIIQGWSFSRWERPLVGQLERRWAVSCEARRAGAYGVWVNKELWMPRKEDAFEAYYPRLSLPFGGQLITEQRLCCQLEQSGRYTVGLIYVRHQVSKLNQSSSKSWPWASQLNPTLFFPFSQPTSPLLLLT